VFANVGAAYLYRQAELTKELLEKQVLELINFPEKLQQMSEKMANLALVDSAERLADLVRQTVEKN
jgi:UDP-N-acetylglucosamine--N-acetylmuramyl-(pentapeptide) pyrophosphoryl-undecaprenol N-acetylglucosamine transferase